MRRAAVPDRLLVPQHKDRLGRRRRGRARGEPRGRQLVGVRRSPWGAMTSVYFRHRISATRRIGPYSAVVRPADLHVLVFLVTGAVVEQPRDVEREKAIALVFGASRQIASLWATVEGWCHASYLTRQGGSLSWHANGGKTPPPGVRTTPCTSHDGGELVK